MSEGTYTIKKTLTKTFVKKVHAHRCSQALHRALFELVDNDEDWAAMQGKWEETASVETYEVTEP